MVKSRKRKSISKSKKKRQKGSKFVEDFIRDLEENKKIRIIEKIYGKKAVNLTKKLFFRLDSVSKEAKDWMQNWSEYQKSHSALIVYQRKKIKNKVIGFKLAIGTGDNVSVTGEEHNYEKGLQIIKDFRDKLTRVKSSRRKRKSGRAVKIGLKLPNFNFGIGVGRGRGRRRGRRGGRRRSGRRDRRRQSNYYRDDFGNWYFNGEKIDAGLNFVVLKNGYAKDSFNAYYRGKKIPGVGLNFVVLNGGYAKDAFNTYYRGKKI